MAPTRVRFATLVDPEILAAFRDLAEKEGRQLQVLLEEALKDLLEKRKSGSPRSHVTASYLASHEKYAPLYKKLAE